jgi:SAM-dependent methyltransferase
MPLESLVAHASLLAEKESFIKNHQFSTQDTPKRLVQLLPSTMRSQQVTTYLEYLLELAECNLIPTDIKMHYVFAAVTQASPTEPIPNSKKYLRKSAEALLQTVSSVIPTIAKSRIGIILNNYRPYDVTTWKSYLQALQKAITHQNVQTHSSHPYLVRGYTNYYSTVTPHVEDETAWNNKQRNVVKIIRDEKPATVLDLGCCTGWYAIKAAQNNATVFGTDIDEDSLRVLTEVSLHEQLPIYPLKLSFEDLASKKMFKTLHNCDMVLCLALLHHLVIVNGISPVKAIQQLAHITPKTLILEFVDLSDERIQYPYKHPEAMKSPKIYNFAKNNLENLMSFYTREFVINELKKYFSSIEIQASTPESTRSLLVCKK